MDKTIKVLFACITCAIALPAMWYPAIYFIEWWGCKACMTAWFAGLLGVDIHAQKWVQYVDIKTLLTIIVFLTEFALIVSCLYFTGMQGIRILEGSKKKKLREKITEMAKPLTFAMGIAWVHFLFIVDVGYAVGVVLK